MLPPTSLEALKSCLSSVEVGSGIDGLSILLDRVVIPLAYRLEKVAHLQSRALAQRPQERGFLFPEAFALTPVSQSAP